MRVDRGPRVHEGLDFDTLLMLFALIVGAALAVAPLSRRLNVPVVVLQILVGVVLGPTLFDVVRITGSSEGEILHTFGEIGALLLLFEVGLEIDIDSLARVGASATRVAIAGVVVPIAGAIAVTSIWGISSSSGLMIAGSLAATSVGITARVFTELHVLDSVEARVVLSAAVIDDVLGILVLGIAVPIATGDGVGSELALTMLEALGFLLVAAAAILLAPRFMQRVRWKPTGGETPFLIAMIVMMVVSALAGVSKLTPIIGAVAAGVLCGASPARAAIHERTRVVGTLLIPVFFVGIGATADLKVMGSWNVLGLGAALVAVGVVGKVSAGFVLSGVDRLAVGLGMVPRGEVGLIFASIGLTVGALSNDQYAAVLLAVMATTLIAPPLLRMRLARGAQAEGVGETVGIGDILDAASRIVRGERPGSDTTARLRRGSIASHSWHAHERSLFVDLLRTRSTLVVRFLDSVAFWERCVPEAVPAPQQHRWDDFQFDPDFASWFPVVDRVMMADPNADPSVVLAAAIWDLGVDQVSRDRIAESMGVAETVGPICQAAGAVNDAMWHGLGIDERTVTRLSRMVTADRLEEVMDLTRAISDLDEEYADRLNELQRLLEREASHAPTARRLVEAAFDEAAEAVLARLATCPEDLLVSVEPEELAAAIATIDPVPGPGRVRVQQLGQSGHVAVVCRSVPGVGARTAAALSECALDIRHAVVGTWGDRAWLGIFAVDASAIDERALDAVKAAAQRGMQRRFTNRRFEEGAEYSVTAIEDPFARTTRVIVDGPDRAGLLCRLLSAVERPEFLVVSVSAHTAGEGKSAQIHNTIELTHRDRRPLNERERKRLLAALNASA